MGIFSMDTEDGKVFDGPQEVRMGNMKLYTKRASVPMEPWTPEVDMTNVSVHPTNAEHGHPKAGDFVAHDPANIIDRWLVTAEYHAATYKEVS